MAKPDNYFLPTAVYTAPEPGHVLCVKVEAVTLQQRAHNRFTVRYGKQVRSNLTYEAAAAEFGECVMHQAACEGLLDNHFPGDDRA